MMPTKGGGGFGRSLGGCGRILPWLPCWLAQVLYSCHDMTLINFDVMTSIVCIIHQPPHYQPTLDFLLASFNHRNVNNHHQVKVSPLGGWGSRHIWSCCGKTWFPWISSGFKLKSIFLPGQMKLLTIPICNKLSPNTYIYHQVVQKALESSTPGCSEALRWW